MFNESPFKSIITDIRSNLSKRVEELKDLTYSQVKRFKEKLIKFNNDSIKKIKLRKILMIIMKNITKDIKYLSDDFSYEDIRCLFNESNKILSSEILNLMKLNLMRFNIMRLDLMKLNLMRLFILILNPLRLHLMRSNIMRLDLIKLTILTLNPVRLNLTNLYLTTLNPMKLNLMRITV